MFTNRRATQRLAIGVSVTVYSASAFWTGFTENISEGGLFVATNEPLDIGDQLDVSLVIEGEPPISVRGVVRWLRLSQGANGPAPGAGMQFDSLDEETALRITRFIRTRRDALFYDLD
jgi:uncharacterized protein (TIGR02266 family)